MKRISLFGLFVILWTLPATAQPKFDRTALLDHVRVLASDEYEGRETGTPGSEKARTYLLEQFRDIGLASFNSSFALPFSFTSRRSEETINGVNVVGFVGGREQPDRYIVMTAHYDHLGVREDGIFNGADDNASGTAGLLIAAAYFVQNPPMHSIVFAALDAEEKGLQGARAFVADPPVDRERIALNVNLDMISHNDKGELYITGTHHYPFLKPYLEEAAGKSDLNILFGHDLPGTGSDDWTTASDHGPFHTEWGLPFVYFGVEDHADYHKESDEFETIVPDFYVKAVDAILDAVIVLDANLAEIEAAK